MSTHANQDRSGPSRRRRLAEGALAVVVCLSLVAGVAWALGQDVERVAPRAVALGGADADATSSGGGPGGSGGPTGVAPGGGSATVRGGGAEDRGGATGLPGGATLPRLSGDGRGVDWDAGGGADVPVATEGPGRAGSGPGDPGGREVETSGPVPGMPRDPAWLLRGADEHSSGVPEGAVVSNHWTTTCAPAGDGKWLFRWNLVFANGAVVSRELVVGSDEGVIEEDAEYGKLPTELAFSTTMATCSAV